MVGLRWPVMARDIRVGIVGTAAGAVVDDERAGFRAREAAGFDHILWGDHVSFFTGAGRDGLIQATRILTATEWIGAYGGVYLLPLRHPVPVARQVVDIASFAPGRLTFGVGVGGEDRHEVEVCGVDPATRGRRTDESLEILRGLLTGEPIDHVGEHFSLARAQIQPACDPPVPLIVGGRSDAAVRRAGRFGDGWLGVWNSPERFTAVTEKCAIEAEAAGRDEVRWQHAMQVWCGVGDGPVEARAHVAGAMEDFYQTSFERFERYTPFGRPDEIAAFLVPYVAAGCTAFNLIPAHPDDSYAVDACAEVRTLLRTTA